MTKIPLSVTLPPLDAVEAKLGDFSRLEMFILYYQPRGEPFDKTWRNLLSAILMDAKKEALQDYRAVLDER